MCLADSLLASFRKGEAERNTPASFFVSGRTEMNTMISVVIPAYNEAESIPELYRQLTQGLSAIPDLGGHQLIFVDDGSTDGTKARIEELAKADTGVQLISFEKNRGKAAGLTAGFQAAEGELVFTIDADLQDDPVEMPRFVRKMEEGYDLVSGWKENRQDPLEKRLPSLLFNKVVSLSFGIPLHDFDCGYKLYRREVVKRLQLEGGLYRFIPVFAAEMGYRVGELPVRHHRRQYGHSKYGFKRYFVGLRDYLRVLWRVKGDHLRRSLNKPEILRYLVAGILTTVINLGGFQLLNTLGLDYKLSNAIALISCKVFAYLANKYYVFRSRNSSVSEFFGELFRYVTARGLTGLLDYVLLIAFVEGLHLDANLSKYGIQVLVILLNYILGKRLVFRKKQDEDR